MESSAATSPAQRARGGSLAEPAVAADAEPMGSTGSTTNCVDPAVITTRLASKQRRIDQQSMGVCRVTTLAATAPAVVDPVARSAGQWSDRISPGGQSGDSRAVARCTPLPSACADQWCHLVLDRTINGAADVHSAHLLDCNPCRPGSNRSTTGHQGGGATSGIRTAHVADP